MIYINDNIDAFDVEAALPLLSDERREQTLRFRFERGRKTCAAAYLLLCEGLKKEYGITEKFGLQFGLLYSMEGYKGKGIAVTGQGQQIGAYIADAKFNFDYLNIPILAQYYVVKGLAVKAGIQPAFNVRHKASVDGNTTNIEGVKSFNFSIPVGLSYEYQNFVLDARYNIGVTKIYKEADQGRNSTFAITLGYKFAL